MLPPSLSNMEAFNLSAVSRSLNVGIRKKSNVKQLNPRNGTSFLPLSVVITVICDIFSLSYVDKTVRNTIWRFVVAEGLIRWHRRLKLTSKRPLRLSVKIEFSAVSDSSSFPRGYVKCQFQSLKRRSYVRVSLLHDILLKKIFIE